MPIAHPKLVDVSNAWDAMLRGRGSAQYSPLETDIEDAARKSKRPVLSSWRRLAGEARLRWSLLSPVSRGVLAVLLTMVSMHIVFGTVDLFFHSYGTGKQPVVHEKEFSVVINTYKRHDQLVDALQHYAENCGRRSGVGRIYVIWAESPTPPDPESFFQNRLRNAENRSPVEFIAVKNSLNSRFLPIDGLPTQAVFMVDDDVRVDCFSLHLGFEAFRAYPDSTVGFYPRLASPPRGQTTGYIEHTWPIVYLQQKTNFILTKACFLHQRFLSAYSAPSHPKEILDYVDKYMNCEDVAMSLLVANVTAAENSGIPAPPIFVEASISDKGLFNGISTGKGFVERRAACLTDLTHVYEERGWGRPLDYVFDLPSVSWVQHAPNFWWQARPSNFFEWFALLDFFK